ncbi:hypothetical protein OC844_000933 [Tilletia horrida]|nr:hypothetical protein OC844_000933 [Tilletia horrida]
MVTLLRRTRTAVWNALSSKQHASSRSSTGDDGDDEGGHDNGAGSSGSKDSIVDDILAFNNLSTAALRAMGSKGQILHLAITAGADPHSLVGAKLAAHTQLSKQAQQQQQHASRAASSSSSSSSSTASSSFASRFDLPSHLGGAGVLGFLTSRWFCVLVLTTALINRINHICRPRNRPQPVVGWKRVALKTPALVLLTLSMVSLLGTSIMLADISRQYASVEYWNRQKAAAPSAAAAGIPAPAGTLAVLMARVLPSNWAQRAWQGDVFINPTTGLYRIEARASPCIWAAFLAAAAAVITESLIKSLEGTRDQDMPTFNLTGFAYITHAYVFSPDSERGYPGSPTWSLFFSTFLQIAELWTLSVASLTRSRPRARLPVTTFFGIASTIHHLHWRYIGNPTDPLHIMNRFPDAILLVIIILTAFLHALTMAVTEGQIEFSRLLFNASNLPALTEDYNLALFKLGTACLESTRLSGMSRELATIRTPPGTWVEMDSGGGVDVHGGAAQSARGVFGSSNVADGGLRRRRPAAIEARKGSSEDERDMIVRHRRSSRRSKDRDGRRGAQRRNGQAAESDDSDDSAELDPAQAAHHRIATLRNGFALEIRDLRTAADGTFSRSSLAILSGTSPTRIAEARRFGVTLFRVLLSLASLAFAWSWSWLPPVARLPLEQRVLRPARRRTRRVVRWLSGTLPRYVRLVWHGRNGETRRELASRARLDDQERRARERAARVVPPSAGMATEVGQDRAQAATAGAGRGLDNELALRRAMRAMSPESAAGDTRFWRAYLAPDVPEWQDEGSDEDGEWRDEDDESEDDDGGEGEEQEDDGVRDPLGTVSAQLQARSERLRRMRSPSVHLSDIDFDDEDEGPLALTLAAQRPEGADGGGDVSVGDVSTASASGAIDGTMSQYLLVHMSHDGRSPLTRNRYRQIFAAAGSSSATGPLPSRFAPGSGPAVAAPAPADDREVLIDVIRTRREMAVQALERQGAGAAMLHGGAGADDEQRAEWERERQRLCVICQTENRTILIWPCRCLALCEDCRDNLASRPVGGKTQTCPCCRTPVAGFSRLFLP